ncbi:MAG: hypothetical protein HZB16_03940 [Armatimonadetes bacterium]|nr:hypothetical protein [Armatimonadota bacterium]
MQDIRVWAEALGRRMGNDPVLEEDQTYTVGVEVPEGERVLVTLYGDEIDEGPAMGAPVLMMRAAAGGSNEEADLQELLIVGAGTWFARLYFEAETDSYVAEAALPMVGLTEAMLEQAAIEVAELSINAYDVVGDGDDEDDDEEDDEEEA